MIVARLFLALNYLEVCPAYAKELHITGKRCYDAFSQETKRLNFVIH